MCLHNDSILSVSVRLGPRWGPWMPQPLPTCRWKGPPLCLHLGQDGATRCPRAGPGEDPSLEVCVSRGQTQVEG